MDELIEQRVVGMLNEAARPAVGVDATVYLAEQITALGEAMVLLASEVDRLRTHQ